MFVATIDVWGTLIKASPTFKKAKIELVRETFGIDNLNDWRIEEAFESSKKSWNYVIERSGIQPTDRQVFDLFFNNLKSQFIGNKKINSQIDKYLTNTILFRDFFNKYQKLCLDHPPVIYSEETLEYIEKLSVCLDRLIISSNTMFISGNSLHTHLINLGVANFINAFRFSDKKECAKPDRRMYALENLNNKVFHIGDNVITDYEAPNRYGVEGILINSNNLTIKDAYDYIIDQIK